MHILVTNDDGADAAGLRILADALRPLAIVSVVAPAKNCSGVSHSLTMRKRIAVQVGSQGEVRVSGTPTDCVRLAYAGLLGPPPDMVVSGINAGPNLSDDVLYSGTVAAALEGRFLDHPGIAISLAGEFPTHFETAALCAFRMIERLREEPLPPGLVLNVNVPDVSVDELQGIKVTHLAKRHGVPRVEWTTPLEHGRRYWKMLPLPGPDVDPEPGSDVAAVLSRHVSVTPVWKYVSDATTVRAVEGWAQFVSPWRDECQLRAIGSTVR